MAYGTIHDLVPVCLNVISSQSSHRLVIACMHAKLLQLCPTLHDTMDCSLLVSSIYGIFQARILKWVPMPFSKESSWPRDWTCISYISCTDRCVLYHQHHTGSPICAQFSRSVVSDSMWPHESQHTRPPRPSPTPGVYSNSCPSSQWCRPAISSSVVPFSSCPQSLPASGSFPVNWLFAWGGQSIGASASASVLPMNTQQISARVPQIVFFIDADI